MKKKRRKRVESFLKDRKPILNITGFERAVGVPKGTIQKFLSNDREIDDDRILKMDNYLLNAFIDYEDIDL